jgi:hypothetical protein
MVEVRVFVADTVTSVSKAFRESFSSSDGVCTR